MSKPLPQQHAASNNPLHMIHRWSIDHPQIIIAFYTAVLLAAIYAVVNVIPRRFAPYVQSPMVAVVTMMPGLSAHDMETYVSQPMEAQLVNIKNLHFIRSTSQEGLSVVTLEFNYGQDIHTAILNIQSQLNVAQANLPATGANLKPSFILPVDSLNLPVVSLALTGDPSQGWTPQALRQFADNTVVNRLKRLPQVTSAVIFGGYRRQMQIIVNRNKLAAYGLSLLDVRDAIDRYNVSKPGGVVTGTNHEGIVEVGTPAVSAAQIATYPIVSTAGGAAVQGPAAASASGGGMGGGGGSGAAPVATSNSSPTNTTAFQRFPRTVRVGDVARVVDTSWERRSAFNYLDHKVGTKGRIIPAIEVSVIQDPAASSYSLLPKVQKITSDLEKEYPGIKFQQAYNNAHFVGILFHNVWEELFTAVILTALVVVLFLGEWRGTLIAMITLPTSLAMAVLMLVPFHMTFNSGTLIGLLLCIGRLVDDTIIDIHSVERHLRMGKSAREATIDGIAEVRVAVIASTLMLVIALTPLLVSGGITQLMFQELVWPLIFGLIASMLVSFTLTALLCAKLLRPEAGREADRKIFILAALYFLIDPFQKFLLWLETRYKKSIGHVLGHRTWYIALALVTIIGGVTVYNFIGSEMMPLADVGQAAGVLQMQPGTSFQRTEQAVQQLERIMLKHPEIERASVEIGGENMFETWNPDITGFQMPEANGASMMLTLSDKSKRKANIWQVIDAVQSEAMRTIPGIRSLQIKEMGSDVMASAEAPVYLNIYGKRLSVLNILGNQALALAKKSYGLVQPATSWSMGVPTYTIHVDPARAAAVGLSPVSIAEQAYYALHGGLTNEFFHVPNKRQDTMLVRYRKRDRMSLGDIGNLYLTGAATGPIQLKSVASVAVGTSPTAIEHDGLRRVIGISGYYRKWGPPSMDVTMTLMAKMMEHLDLPPGYGIEMRGDMTQMMSSFRRMLNGLVLSLALMYLVLVAQFRGFLQPLQMLASLPLELSGVFIALFIAHTAFSTVSILGVIVLTGMDITTAILMIDMIMRFRDQGMTRDAAVMEACPQRLRPILMTSLITLVVMIPVAFAPKTGLDAYQPLAVAIVGGLTVGTVLSLFVIPVMHTLVDDLIQFLHRTFLRREWQWSGTSAVEVSDVDPSGGEI